MSLHAKINEMETLVKVMLDILARKTVLEIDVWEQILDAFDFENTSMALLTPVFAAVLQSGRLDLIELFCFRGMNPFTKPTGSPAPAIFGLASKKAGTLTETNYLHIFQHIFAGMKRFWIRKVAGIKEQDYSKQGRHYQYDWRDTGTLLQRAITSNHGFADFLITYSDPEVKSGHNWTPLHEATLVDDRLLMSRLLYLGHDPSEMGTRYIKDEEYDHAEGSLTKRFVKDSSSTHQWWDDVDCYDLSTMRKESNAKFLSEHRKKYLARPKSPPPPYTSLSSLNVEVGAEDESQEGEEEEEELPPLE